MDRRFGKKRQWLAGLPRASYSSTAGWMVGVIEEIAMVGATAAGNKS